MLNSSLKTGLSFGLTSGVITTLGLMVGLISGTHSRLAVLGGILTIAVADAFSDALGVHVSVESTAKYGPQKIWQATIAAFLAKFFLALTFVLPVLLFDLSAALFAGVVWGFLVLGILNFWVAKEEKIKPWKVVGSHFLIAVVVVITTYLLGELIGKYLR